jgi:hypothetical protein
MDLAKRFTLVEPSIIVTNLVKKSFGIDKYAFIIKEISKRHVSQDSNYQRVFNAFYVVRRNSKWRKIYYEYFESQKKNKHLTFEIVLRYLYEKTGQVEASFSSKLLSTITPDMPIWDVYVLKNLGLKMKLGKPQDKIEQAIRLYQEIQETYMRLVKSEWGRSAIVKFNEVLPDSRWISDTKKIDFFIWQTR